MMGEEKRRSQSKEIGQLRAPIVLAHEKPFAIGNAAFFPATREIRFAGQTSIVEPKVMQLLVALHRAGGAVVNKDDLLQSCWEGRIVGEDAINRVVSRLRSVVDRAGRPFRIETITKVGYRLLATSGAALDGIDHEFSPVGQAADRPTFWSRRAMAGAVAGPTTPRREGRSRHDSRRRSKRHGPRSASV